MNNLIILHLAKGILVAVGLTVYVIAYALLGIVIVEGLWLFAAWYNKRMAKNKL
ncbi:MAG: hypothetical protein WDO14_21205 [Bacteroidota bacterium]